MEKQELDFIKGFNNGYLLAKHEPELVNKLIKNPANDNEYMKGLAFGHEEYEMEKNQNKSKDQSHDKATKNKDHELDKDRE